MAKWWDMYGREWEGVRPTGRMGPPTQRDEDGVIYVWDEKESLFVLYREYVEMVSPSDRQRKMKRLADMKTITTESFAAPPRPKQRVQCPDHGVWMRYVPSDDIMVCGEDGCTNISVRRQPTFSELFEMEDGVVRVVYRGELELVKAEDGTRYLHLVGVNGLVDITELMKGAPEPSPEPEPDPEARFALFDPKIRLFGQSGVNPLADPTIFGARRFSGGSHRNRHLPMY